MTALRSCTRKRQYRLFSSIARTTPRQVYHQLVASNQLDRDVHQSKVVDALEAVWQRHYAGGKAEQQQHDKSWSTWLWRADAKEKSGLYLYGTVGTGKTMLMDLFYTTVPTGRKQRVHFHAFMLDVHASILLSSSRDICV